MPARPTSEDHAGYRVGPAAEEADGVEIENADASPVERADNGEDQRDPVYNHPTDFLSSRPRAYCAPQSGKNTRRGNGKFFSFMALKAEWIIV